MKLWQWKWRKTEVDPCGTFYSTIDFATNVDCGNVLLSTVDTTNTPTAAIYDTDGNGLIDDQEYLGGGALPGLPQVVHTADNEPDDNDQFGVAVRYYAEELNDTEFGLYYMQYHNKIPVIEGQVLQDGTDYGYFNLAYPENIKLLGVSFNTSTESGYSVSGEVSY